MTQSNNDFLQSLYPVVVGNIVIDGRGSGKEGASETVTRKREKQSSIEEQRKSAFTENSISQRADTSSELKQSCPETEE